MNLQTQRLQGVPEEDRAEAIATLRQSVASVHNYMNLYEFGGVYEAEGRNVPVEALSYPDDIQAFNELKAWWVDYKQRLNPVLDGGADIAPVAQHIFNNLR